MARNISGRKTGNIHCRFFPNLKSHTCQIVVSGKTHQCDGTFKERTISKHNPYYEFKGNCKGW